MISVVCSLYASEMLGVDSADTGIRNEYLATEFGIDGAGMDEV